MAERSTGARMIDFVRTMMTGRVDAPAPTVGPEAFADIPEPPAVERSSPGGYALFKDENEQEILWAKPWPYSGCPTDDRTNSTTWLIEGQEFTPSHRDGDGNWIFRRSV